jgi:hypothetical protein
MVCLDAMVVWRHLGACPLELVSRTRQYFLTVPWVVLSCGAVAASVVLLILAADATTHHLLVVWGWWSELHLMARIVMAAVLLLVLSAAGIGWWMGFRRVCRRAVHRTRVAPYIVHRPPPARVQVTSSHSPHVQRAHPEMSRSDTPDTPESSEGSDGKGAQDQEPDVHGDAATSDSAASTSGVPEARIMAPPPTPFRTGGSPRAAPPARWIRSPRVFFSRS